MRLRVKNIMMLSILNSLIHVVYTLLCCYKEISAYISQGVVFVLNELTTPCLRQDTAELW